MKCGWAKAMGVRHRNIKRLMARRLYDARIDGNGMRKGRGGITKVVDAVASGDAYVRRRGRRKKIMNEKVAVG
jgi:hypothetical protein